MQQINCAGCDGQPSHYLAFLTPSSYYLHSYFTCSNRAPTTTLRDLVRHIFDEMTNVLESQLRAPTTMSLFAPPLRLRVHLYQPSPATLHPSPGGSTSLLALFSRSSTSSSANSPPPR